MHVRQILNLEFFYRIISRNGSVRITISLQFLLECISQRIPNFLVDLVTKTSQNRLLYNTSQKKNPVHSMAMYLPDFQSQFALKFYIFQKNPSEKSYSSWFHACFDTFWAPIDQLRYEQWSFWKFLNKIAYFLFFLLNKSVNLDWKGINRSVKS